MRLDILLAPPGDEAARVLREWLQALDLKVAENGQVEVSPDRCFEALVELRRRCYDLGLIVNGKFLG